MRLLSVMLASVGCLSCSLFSAGIAQAEKAPAKGPMPNVSIFYGPSVYSSSPVSTATAYYPKSNSFLTCAPSICGRFAVIGRGANKELVLQVSSRDKIISGAFVYTDRAGDYHQVAHVTRGKAVPFWTNITALGSTARYHLVSAEVEVLDPREASTPPAPACISSCVGGK